MEKPAFRKVQRLEQFSVVERTANGLRRHGPYWRGIWYEKGKEKRVYVGKELPKSLKHLLEGRYRRPGYKNYTWPGQKAKAEK